MKFVFLTILFFCNFEIFGQAISLGSPPVVWTNSVLDKSAVVCLSLTKMPYEEKITFSGEMALPGKSATTTNMGDLFELSSVRFSTNQQKVVSSAIWSFAYFHPKFVAIEDASVNVVPVQNANELALLLSKGYDEAPCVSLVDPFGHVNPVVNDLLITNKSQLLLSKLEPSGITIDLEKFKNWEKLFKDGLNFASAEQSDDTTTLTLTNATGRRFRFVYLAAQNKWHAYDFWGELKQVK